MNKFYIKNILLMILMSTCVISAGNIGEYINVGAYLDYFTGHVSSTDYEKFSSVDKMKYHLFSGYSYYSDFDTLRTLFTNATDDEQKMVIDYCMKHFDKVTQSLLWIILECKPEVCKSFTPLIAQHFDKTSGETLEAIMKGDPEAVKEFTALAVKHLDKVSGYNLQKIMLYNPEAAKEFTARAVNHFDGDTINSNTLWSIIKVYPAAAKEFTPLAVKYFDKIKDDLLFLEAIMKNNPDAAKEFTPCVVQHFQTIDSYILARIIEYYPEMTQGFIPLVIKHFDKMGADVLEAIMKVNPEIAKEFELLAMEHFDTINSFALKTMMNHSPEFADECLKKIDPKLYALIRESKPLTQSVAHLRKNKAEIIWAYRVNAKLRENKEFVHTILKKEQDLAQKGYFTAYHAQSSDKYVPILLDTFLYSLRTGKKLEDFLLLHTKKDVLYENIRNLSGGLFSLTCKYAAARRVVLEKQYNRRKQLLNGVRGAGQEFKSDTYKLLFLNDSLFGNTTCEGENSYPYYFYKNKNAFTEGLVIANNIKDIFDYHGLEKYAAEFGKEIQKLQKEYIKISKYGTLYLLGIPKKSIQKNVVFVRPYGYAAKCSIQGCVTKDMQKIADALVTDEYIDDAQKDFKQYVATMTRDKLGLLNPDSGLKVFPFMIPVDKQRYQKWQTKWKDLTTRLAQRIAQERDQLWGYHSARVFA